MKQAVHKTSFYYLKIQQLFTACFCPQERGKYIPLAVSILLQFLCQIFFWNLHKQVHDGREDKWETAILTQAVFGNAVLQCKLLMVSRDQRWAALGFLVS